MGGPGPDGKSGTRLSAPALSDQIERELAALGDPTRAEREKAYLKSDLQFFGVTVPAIRRAAKAVEADRPALTRSAVLETAGALWERPVFECRLAAVFLLELYADRLEAADLALLESMLRESGTWALVDNLAATVVGPLAERCPELGADLDRWAADDDFWMRRSALLAHLGPLRAGGGDFDRFAGYADAMLEEKEFFVRKAIGWVLRDTARKRPDLVYGWLAPRTHRVSGVTIREAVKPLPDDRRDKLMAAYRDRRPAG